MLRRLGRPRRGPARVQPVRQPIRQPILGAISPTGGPGVLPNGWRKGAGIAELSREGDELVLTLSTLEKAESVHGNIRVPMSSVREVEVLDDVIHAVHGLRYPGTHWPGKLAIGRITGPIETKTFGKTFPVVHHDTPRGLRVRLDGVAFDQLLVGCEDPEAVKSAIGEAS